MKSVPLCTLIDIPFFFRATGAYFLSLTNGSHVSQVLPSAFPAERKSTLKLRTRYAVFNIRLEFFRHVRCDLIGTFRMRTMTFAPDRTPLFCHGISDLSSLPALLSRMRYSLCLSQLLFRIHGPSKMTAEAVIPDSRRLRRVCCYQLELEVNYGWGSHVG